MLKKGGSILSKLLNLRRKPERIHGSDSERSTSTNTSNIYRSIKELPFRNFKICAVDKDLSALIISGDVPSEELVETWDSIQEEFSMTVGGSDIKTTIRNIQLVESTNSKVNRLTSALLLFIQTPIIEFTEIFKNEGWVFSLEDPFEYVRYMRNKIASLQIKLEESVKKIEKNQDNKEPTHEEYADIMAEIRKFEGYVIPDTITTFEFCTHYKRLVRHIDGSRTTR